MNAPFIPLAPYDEHNQVLEANVHPSGWSNPQPVKPYHLVVVGAGTAGLVTAAGAAGLGAQVALVERELMGGDCLNVGCVPSKAIIHAARVAATTRDAGEVGIGVDPASIRFAEVMSRMRRLRAKISPADSAKRFSGLGVDVYFGKGSFQSDSVLSVSSASGETRQLKFKKAVIASGARAAAPPIPGLDQVDYLTNETLFSLTELPARLGVIGSGPIGSEMAQSFARLGSQVTLFERGEHVLTREDPDAAAVVQREMERDGIRIMANSEDMQIATAETGIRVTVTQAGQTMETVVDKLLVAVGRAPNIEGLQLDTIGVESNDGGVVVNEHLQTTNPRIFAAGDICSRFKFTHAADFMARIVIQNALFAVGPFGKKKASDLLIPRATYTSPEIAHVGLDENDASSGNIDIDTYRIPFADVDRAILEGQDLGFAKIHTKRGTDQILGATIVAENAGDMISEITLAMTNRIGLGKIASTIHPYPTQAEAIRRLGDQFNRTKLTPTSKRVLGLLRWFNVGG
ncbi:MAG: mercuric reductase [Planctomycetota bacterium]